MNVELNTSGRATGDVTNDIMAIVDRLQLPPGVSISMGGDAEGQQEVFGQIFSALGVAVMLMYLILVVQFGSFLDPLAIMMSLPLSLIGVMTSTFLTLLVIPTFYEVMDEIRTAFSRKVGLQAPKTAEHPVVHLLLFELRADVLLRP